MRVIEVLQEKIIMQCGAYFVKFHQKLDVKPETWEQRILLFAGYLINQNKRAGTVRSYVSAIKTTLRLEGIDINENQFLLGTLTRACKLNNDVWVVQTPIQKGMLKVLLRSISNYYKELNQEYLESLYLAIFSTAYYGTVQDWGVNYRFTPGGSKRCTNWN